MLKHAKSDIISEELISHNFKSKYININENNIEDENEKSDKVRKMTFSFHNEDLHLQKMSKINYKCMNDEDIQSMHENLS